MDGDRHSRLEIQNVSKDYSGVAALTDVSITLRGGEVLGLIGPNGSGKTTLIGVASGVLRPTSGSVAIDSKIVKGGPASFADRGVGRTFQQVRLFEGLSVRETVSIGAIARGVDLAYVDLMLERFKLTDLKDRWATELAYGLQRKVEIARALAGKPRFLLLDEPAAGMNEAESDDLLETLQPLLREFGCGLLIVDHDLSLIMRICDRVVVLNEGLFLAEGSPSEISENPDVIEAYLGAEVEGATVDYS